MQIFHPLGAIVGSLRNRITNPLEGRRKRRGDLVGEQLGQERGLIETAFAFPGWVQGDGNDQVEPPAVQPRIAHGFAEPFGEWVPQMALAPVFEVVHEFAHQSAAAVGRDGRLEMQRTMFAIRAAERLRDRAGKRLGTFRAERRGDPGSPIATTFAKIFQGFICEVTKSQFI